ncbi:hypothetical protein FRB97_002330 [Tulasnella sp. 331]|nr:hypothetical protein FRB97_002330 [Tulasnella sp. 331]
MRDTTLLNKVIMTVRLLTHPTLDRGNCQCKYCSKEKSQHAVNFREGLGPPPPSSTAAQTVTKTKRTRKQAAGSSTRKYIGDSSPAKLALPTSVRHFQAEVRSARWFCVDEIVWTQIDLPLRPRGSQGEEEIEWWPAVVKEAKLKSIAEPYESEKESWGVTQSTVYRLQILGLATQYILPETAILPYQAYIPRTERICELCSYPEPPPDVVDVFPSKSSSVIVTREEEIEDEDGGDLYAEVAAPFAFALQIAGEGLWCGPERIWIGDTVRIKPARKQFRSEELLPPSSAEAGERGLFMKITKIYREVDGIKEDGGIAERGMVAGILYEVAEASPAASDPNPAEQASGSEAKPSPMLDLTSLLAPPSGYRFLSMTRRRYYPALSSSPLLSRVYNPQNLQTYILSLVPTNGVDAVEMKQSWIIACIKNLLGLFGLQAGSASAIDTGLWKAGRPSMLNDAWLRAKDELDGFLKVGFEQRKAARKKSESIGVDAGGGANEAKPKDVSLDVNVVDEGSAVERLARKPDSVP